MWSRNLAYWCNLGIQSKDHDNHKYQGFGQSYKSRDRCNGCLPCIWILWKWIICIWRWSYSTFTAILPVQSNSSSHPGLQSHSPLLQMPLLLQSKSLEQWNTAKTIEYGSDFLKKKFSQFFQISPIHDLQNCLAFFVLVFLVREKLKEFIFQ